MRTLERTLLMLLLASGCASGEGHSGDAGAADAGPDRDGGFGSEDAGLDAGLLPASPDAGTDGGADPVDAGPLEGADSGAPDGGTDAAADAGESPRPPLSGCASSREYLRTDVFIRAGVFRAEGLTIAGERWTNPETGAALVHVNPATGGDVWSRALEPGIFVVRDMVPRGPDELLLVGAQLSEDHPRGNTTAVIDGQGHVVARDFEPWLGSTYYYLEYVRPLVDGRIRSAGLEGWLREMSPNLALNFDRTERWSGHPDVSVTGMDATSDGGSLLVGAGATSPRTGLLRRHSSGGTTLWDRDLAAPPGTSFSATPTVVVGLPLGDVLVLFREGGASRLTSTGEVIWSRRVTATPSLRYVSALAISDTQVLALAVAPRGAEGWSETQVQLIDTVAGEVVDSEVFGTLGAQRNGVDLSARTDGDGYEYAITGWSRPAGATQITTSYIQFGRCTP